MSTPPPQFHSRIWLEEASPDDPFTAERCYCSGYDVYGEIIKHASYIEYLYLLFCGERPDAASCRALEILALALANPGPRNPAVHAAMSAGVGGSPAAAALIAALAAGAGAAGGSREIYRCMEAWEAHPQTLTPWLAARQDGSKPEHPARREVWPDTGYCPGFAPNTRSCPLPVRQTLALLTACLPTQRLAWLQEHRESVEEEIGSPLGMTGVAAAALLDLGFSPSQGEMLTLLLGLPGAAAHALEQQEQGIRHFPFFGMNLLTDPEPPSRTPDTP
ncbi:hypothetical protein VX159_05285 [Dechloromonas sp. ZY10]|uniref:hypothetical protein n=1 Tax=Dechloromonas aquae TaxID=2664436 RepID=UPI0035282809